jgi:predicted RNase H-like nuclease (RuvC/YqgF family)
LSAIKIQLSNHENKAKREKSFEVGFQEYYNKEQDLQHKIRELIESNRKLVSKLENEKCELKQQVEQLQKELSKTQIELSTCKKEFYEHKVRKRKKEDSYLNDIVDLEAKLKV